MVTLLTSWGAFSTNASWPPTNYGASLTGWQSNSDTGDVFCILKHDPDAKVLVVSALDQQDVLKNAIKLGAADFIVKPFQKDGLIGALEKMTGGQRC